MPDAPYPAAGVRVVLDTMLKECLDAQHIPLVLISQSTKDRGSTLRVQRIGPLSIRTLRQVLETALEWARVQPEE